MRKTNFLLLCCLLLGGVFIAEAQKTEATKSPKQSETTAAVAEKEIKEFRPTILTSGAAQGNKQK